MPDPKPCTSATGCPSVSDDTITDGLIVVGYCLSDREASKRSGGKARIGDDEGASLVPRAVMLDWADSQRHDRALADSEAQGQAARDQRAGRVYQVVVTVMGPTRADAQHWAESIGHVVAAEFGDSMRLQIDVRPQPEVVDLRQLHGAQIAHRIRAELVCCTLYDRLNADGRTPTEAEMRQVDSGMHSLCYWGDAAAHIAETPEQWQDDPDECAQGCPKQCRHQRAADELTRLDEELGRLDWPSMSTVCFIDRHGECEGCFECPCHAGEPAS